VTTTCFNPNQKEKTMTRANAKRDAMTRHNPGTLLAIVAEGLHADDHAERDADGESYGYCPPTAVPILYRFGRVVEVVRAIHPEEDDYADGN
jgi:hypothetical protein